MSRPSAPGRIPAALALAAGALLAITALPAWAHEYWLAPNRWTAAPGETITVAGAVGTGFRGERRPFARSRCVRFVARAGATLDLARAAVDADPVWARIAPTDTGGMMLAYESDFASIELPADEFNEYLALEGLDAPLAARRRAGSTNPGRERYRRCAKAWIDGGDTTRALRAIGLPLEIVPLERLGRAPALRLRVLRDGRPVAGVLVRAWRTALAADGHGVDPAARDSVGIAWGTRTNAAGDATILAADPGEWLVSAVHMVPCLDAELGDWESTWASLTFARRPGAR